jgi:predicted tellurium resistance membrane protein TerC
MLPVGLILLAQDVPPWRRAVTACSTGSRGVGRIGLAAPRPGTRMARGAAMQWLTDPGIWASLVTLSALEIVLGVDNLVFVAVVASRLPAEQRRQARQIGLLLALPTRLALLAAIVWVIGLTRPVFLLLGHAVSLRDVVLLAGGLFLLCKSTREIHRAVEGGERNGAARGGTRLGFVATVSQIMLVDVVFSFDSVITAIGMASRLWIMAAAIVIAVAIMLAGSAVLADFCRAPSDC